MSRSLADTLAATPETAALLERVKASQRAATVLAEPCRQAHAGFDPLEPGACEWRDRQLVLSARSPAQASKLRQVLPALLTALRAQGLGVDAVKVRMQPPGAWVPAPAPIAATRDVPPAALYAVAALAANLPDSPLRRAAERLQRALARSPRPG